MRLVASVLMALLLAACGGRAKASPPWPKQSEKEVDGGESLEPRTLAALPEEEDDEEEVVAVTPEEKPAEAPAPVEDKPATPDPPAAPPDEPITTEEIVIEIED